MEDNSCYNVGMLNGFPLIFFIVKMFDKQPEGSSSAAPQKQALQLSPGTSGAKMSSPLTTQYMELHTWHSVKSFVD